MLTYVIYFLTVVLPGTAFLFAAWRYDEKHVPTGQNFMPSIEELKTLKKDIL